MQTLWELPSPEFRFCLPGVWGPLERPTVVQATCVVPGPSSSASGLAWACAPEEGGRSSILPPGDSGDTGTERCPDLKWLLQPYQLHSSPPKSMPCFGEGRTLPPGPGGAQTRTWWGGTLAGVGGQRGHRGKGSPPILTNTPLPDSPRTKRHTHPETASRRGHHPSLHNAHTRTCTPRPPPAPRGT